VKRVRSRQEVLTAVGGAVAVVLGTALLIWLMRPGDSTVPGTGGLAHRQPRATWLVVFAIAGLVAVVVYALRSRRIRNWRVAVAIGVVIVLVLTVIVGTVWPGGLLRKYQALEVPPEISLPPSTPPAGPDSTTAPAGTTAPTTASGATTAPAASTAPTTAAPPPTGG
jgi:hypothetical protein